MPAKFLKKFVNIYIFIYLTSQRKHHSEGESLPFRVLPFVCIHLKFFSKVSFLTLLWDKAPFHLNWNLAHFQTLLERWIFPFYKRCHLLDLTYQLPSSYKTLPLCDMTYLDGQLLLKFWFLFLIGKGKPTHSIYGLHLTLGTSFVMTI